MKRLHEVVPHLTPDNSSIYADFTVVYEPAKKIGTWLVPAAQAYKGGRIPRAVAKANAAYLES